MHVAVDATCWWNRRGFGRFTTGILRALLGRHPGEQWTLLVDRPPAAGELPAGAQVIDVEPGRTTGEAAVASDRRALGDMLRFTRAVADLRPDVVFFPAVYSFFPLPPGTRSVVCFHDTIAESFPAEVFPSLAGHWAWRAKLWLARRQATRVVTVSEASRQALLSRFAIPPDSIDLVTEGADARFHPLADPGRVAATLARLGIEPAPPYLLFVGGLSPHKNLISLLEAMRLALARIDLRLVIVGDPKADGFHANAEQLYARAGEDRRLAARCHFTGYVDDDDLAALYNGALALVLPSLLEGFGLPALEAMACGVPVLASRAGSLPEVVGDAGLYFVPTDPAGIADRIVELASDGATRARLAQRALERSRLFSWEHAADLALLSLRRAHG